MPNTPEDGGPHRDVSRGTPAQAADSGRELHEASRLLRRILVLNDKVEFHTREQLGTSDTDLQAMQMLMHHGQLTPKQLAGQLHLSAAATTTVIDRLVNRGHAERTPHPEDRRRTLIRPLPDAAGEITRLIRPMIDNADEVVWSMEKAEQSAVLDYLSGIIGTMEAFIARLETFDGQDQSTGE